MDKNKYARMQLRIIKKLFRKLKRGETDQWKQIADKFKLIQKLMLASAKLEEKCPKQ